MRLRSSREKTNPRYSGTRTGPVLYAYGGFTLFAASFQTTSAWARWPLVSGPKTPHLPSLFARGFGLACSPFARCYSGNHCCFLFLGLLRCFSSARSQSGFDAGPMRGISPHEEVPFGDPRIIDFMRLPAAFRSSSRPSSASQPSHPPAAVAAKRGSNHVTGTALPVVWVGARSEFAKDCVLFRPTHHLQCECECVLFCTAHVVMELCTYGRVCTQSTFILCSPGARPLVHGTASGACSADRPPSGMTPCCRAINSHRCPSPVC